MMNSTLKPLSASPQNAPPGQLNKPMHPQGTPSAYSQQGGHGPSSLVNMHPNTTAAHSHSQNHYSLNVPTVGSHYMNQGINQNNMGQIPASNHPVANPNTGAPGQIYNPQKTSPYTGNYQTNLGHTQNQNIMPPVSQTLHATTAQVQQAQQQNTNTTVQQQHSAQGNISAAVVEKPQSNGTPETKPSPQKVEQAQTNHLSVSTVKEKPSPTPHAPTPPQASQAQTQSSDLCDKSKSSQVQDVPVEPPKAPDTPESNTPTPPVSNSESSSSSPVTTQSETTSQPTEKSIEEDKEKTGEDSKDEAASTEKKDKVEPSENADSTSKEDPDPKSRKPESTLETKVGDSSPKKESSPPKQATTPKSPLRKARTPKLEESPRTSKEAKTPAQKSPSTGKAKRQRTRTQPYQSPLPELEIISKISSSTPRSKSNDDKLIVFYKNEHLAVRNAEGGFYLCQAVQNVYKSSSKIKIRWLSQDKADKSGEIYTPDFYDLTDFDCILTNLSLSRVDKGKYRLPPAEKERTESILNRSLAVEKGEVTSPSLTEEHPDGLDLSLYKDEEQLKKRKGAKRKGSRSSSRSPAKKPTPAKRSPAAAKTRKASPSKPVKKAAKKAPATPAAKKPAATPEPKKAVGARGAKGKRKSDIKSSPVVDQKKARVLAKIGRKAAVPAAKTPSTPKSSKTAKPSTSSVKKVAPKSSTVSSPIKTTPARSSRRSTRK